jgi:hypothetical protein
VIERVRAEVERMGGRLDEVVTCERDTLDGIAMSAAERSLPGPAGRTAPGLAEVRRGGTSPGGFPGAR